MTPEMKELFDEKISNILGKIHDQNENIHDRLRAIEEKVKKNEYDMGEVNKNLLVMVNDNNKHYFSCPNTKQIDDIYDDIDKIKEKIDKDFQDIKFFARNPKVFFIVVAVVVSVLCLEFWTKLKDVDTRLAKKEYFYRDPNEPIILRGGNNDQKNATSPQIKPSK